MADEREALQLLETALAKLETRTKILSLREFVIHKKTLIYTHDFLEKKRNEKFCYPPPSPRPNRRKLIAPKNETFPILEQLEESDYDLDAIEMKF